MDENNGNHSNESGAIEDREAEATTDKTLTDLEDQQEIGEASDQGEIVTPDSEPHQTPARDDQDLM